MNEQPVQCDTCGKDAKDGWQHIYCNKCAMELDADAIMSRLDDLNEQREEIEEQCRERRFELRQYRMEIKRLRPKVARLQRQLGPFAELVSLAREARDCGSPKARTLFVTAAIEGCANLSVGDNSLVPAPEGGTPDEL